LAGFTLEDSRSAVSAQRNGTVVRSPSRRIAPSRRSICYEQDLHNMQLARRHTSHDIAISQRNEAPVRRGSDGHIDMALAYGDFYQPEFQRTQIDDEQELKGLVAKAKVLLEEAKCVQHSATATMAHLQNNPEAMAAVALTLAEISNLVSKMAPGLIASLKATAPTVFALLASPQFLIAAGVGIGVTIVMFGGYKIIKKITARNENEAMPANGDGGENVDELVELQDEHLSRVEVWRRGVADAGASSVGTSVDGEFITPTAAALSGLDLTRPPRSQAPTAHRSHHPKARSKHTDDVSKVSSRRSTRSRHSSQSKSRSVSGNKEEKAPAKKKKSKGSRLKLMFMV
jgi:hypothetical protein